MREAGRIVTQNIHSRRNLLDTMAEAKRKAQILQDRKNFDEALPKVMEQLMLPPHKDTADAVNHLKKVNVCILLLFQNRDFTDFYFVKTTCINLISLSFTLEYYVQFGWR